MWWTAGHHCARAELQNNQISLEGSYYEINTTDYIEHPITKEQ